MRRLTYAERFRNHAMYARQNGEKKEPVSVNFIKMSEMQDAIDRLAAYEDTGLGPEDMNTIKLLAASADPIKAARLLELAEADADGRVAIFPCHIGETLYAILDGRVYEAAVIGYHSYEWQQEFRLRLLFDTRKIHGCYDFSVTEYGKMIFPTREEAEAALRKEK